MGMLYVFIMVFEVKKLISELKMTLMFMYCTVLYNFVPYCTVKYIFSQNCLTWVCYMSFPWFLGSRNSFLN